MNLKKKFGILLMSLGILVSATAHAKSPKVTTTPVAAIPHHVITMDADYLALAKQRLVTKDPALQPSYDKLMLDANAVLALKPESVTYKKLVPPSGNKSDYMSLAPYWWPDPGKPDGLPYINKDGQFNPSAKNGDTDSVRMQIMCLSTQSVSMAYYFTGERKYAKKTADFIRTWFLDPKTRMNPHLRYGQAIRGVVDGRGTGLIDTRNMWMVIDAALLIEDSGEFSKKEMTALRQWFKEFASWMITSDVGIEEYNAFNNHGMFYDMQLANYELFVGDNASTKFIVQRALDLRMQAQITAEGKQWGELERTTPFHYSAFNLDAMTNIARYGEQVGVDVWKARKKTRGLYNGINYLIPFVANPDTWPYKEIVRKPEELHGKPEALNGKPEIELAQPLLLRAERAYGKGTFAGAAAQIPEITLTVQEYLALYAAIDLPYPSTKTVVDRLIWPVK